MKKSRRERTLLSPYSYTANDPISLIDPDGNEIINPYEKGTANYESVQRAVAVLEQSNPELYSSLESTSIKIHVYMRNPDMNGRKHYGNTSITRDVRTRKGLKIGSTMRDADGEAFGYNSAMLWWKDGFSNEAKGIYSNSDARSIFDAEHLADIYEIDITIDPSLSDKKKAETLAHEGGHSAHALENSFEAWIWGIIGDENHPNGSGHDKYNPSGERADEEEQKSSDFLKSLSTQDWEKIVTKFNEEKNEE